MEEVTCSSNRQTVGPLGRKKDKVHFKGVSRRWQYSLVYSLAEEYVGIVF